MPPSSAPSSRRSLRRRAGSAAAVVLSALAMVFTVATVPGSASTADTPPGDDIEQSANITLLASLGKADPLTATNSDLAFTGDYAVAGNYNGFTIYDIRNPRRPRTVSQVLCPGGQGDVTVSGDLLYFSVDYPRDSESCASAAWAPGGATAWEGVRIFDISDKRNPQYVAAVATQCGSHTHTVIPSDDGETDYVYVSSYDISRGAPGCEPPHDLVSIIEVPVDAPETAAVAAQPNFFPDGGNPDGNYSYETAGCHDFTAYAELDIAAGACMGDGLLLDISDPLEPYVIDQVRDTENFYFWHSATFSNDADKLVFMDELGGGGAATCNTEVGPNRGGNGIYHIEGEGDDRELVFQSYYKIPRHQADVENCVAHNGSLIPVPDRDIMVQAWYQGGVSVWDFTDSANPEEIAYFDRGPVNDERLVSGGPWSTYYYNGYIYSNEIARGFDVLRIRDPRTAGAQRYRFDEFTPQTQQHFGRW
ncbi:LVIVD repeat-containing protein [Allonocardiopsis opalescens]|uniref:LVIVD repeat-containing protein n=1 Tax=Allonocardiopsis opalescens TaxID=1144618 RepID=A0A2T0PVR6_9ACTN|nr:hypothetical protein [Allonocardiopsis opalescens]PRX95520.1 hypothetical protein CLV72_109129 [Allonocardiopsis opalescens]